jgi:hypothetical protein
MAKTLVSLDGGVLVVTEDGGAFNVAIDDSFTVGGGVAAGVITVSGKASLSLSGKQAFDLGMALLEAHSPAPIATIEKAAQGIADAAIAGA